MIYRDRINHMCQTECAIDEETGFCPVCYRNQYEKDNWLRMSRESQTTTIRTIPYRQEYLMVLGKQVDIYV